METFITVLPTGWRRKSAGIEITLLSPYVLWTICVCVCVCVCAAAVAGEGGDVGGRQRVHCGRRLHAVLSTQQQTRSPAQRQTSRPGRHPTAALLTLPG